MNSVKNCVLYTNYLRSIMVIVTGTRSCKIKYYGDKGVGFIVDKVDFLLIVVHEFNHGYSLVISYIIPSSTKL